MANTIDTEKLNEVVQKHIEVKDGQAGLSKEGVKEALEACDMKLEDVQKSQEATTAIFHATLRAVGEPAIEHLAEHKHLDSVTVSQKIGNETQNATIHRQKERTNMQTKEKFINYGEVKTSRTISANKQELTDIKTYIKGIAKAKAL